MGRKSSPEDALQDWLAYFGADKVEYEQKPDFFRIEIRDTTSSGLVRRVWEGTLTPVPSLFDMSRVLLQSLHLELDRKATLHQQLQQKDKDVELWRDATREIESKWDAEKKGQIENFLVLYKIKQEQNESKDQEIATLNQKIEELKLAQTQHSTQRVKPPAYLENEPRDEEFFPESVVQKLASKKRLDLGKEGEDAVMIDACASSENQRKKPASKSSKRDPGSRPKSSDAEASRVEPNGGASTNKLARKRKASDEDKEPVADTKSKVEAKDYSKARPIHHDSDGSSVDSDAQEFMAKLGY